MGMGFLRGDEAGADPDSVRAGLECGRHVLARGDATSSQQEHVGETLADLADQFAQRGSRATVAACLGTLSNDAIHTKLKRGADQLDRRGLHPDACARAGQTLDPASGRQVMVECDQPYAELQTAFDVLVGRGGALWQVSADQIDPEWA
jgi:hypothetical protein